MKNIRIINPTEILFFGLKKQDFETLRSQIATSKRGGPDKCLLGLIEKT